MSSILIIGEAKTNYGLNKVLKQDNLKLVNNLYGESDLTEAFKIAYDIGVTDIYLANIKTNINSLDIIQNCQHYNFNYICPISIRFSDVVYSKQLNKKITYTEVFLRLVSLYTDSILVMTDNHASLYEDIDSYLIDMKNKIDRIKINNDSLLEYGNQLWFVANNLLNTNFANVYLASIMCTNILPNYPKYDLPEAIFDIDNWDIGNYELIYFKNNDLIATSIENFINFYYENNAYKVILIDLVIRKINEGLDLSIFKGRLFNNQIKLKINSYLKDYLDTFKDTLIRDYTINNVDAYLTNDHYYIIVNDFTIFPVNSLEEIRVVLEV